MREDKIAMSSRSFDDILEILKLGKWNHLYFWGVLGLSALMASSVTYFGTYITPPVANYTCIIPPSDFYVNGTDQCSYMVYQNNSDMEELRCTEWTFYEEENTRTITTDFELVCDNAYLRAAYQTCFMAGNFVGAPVTGFLSDKYGRKTMLCLTILICVVSTFLSTFLTNYSSILISRFLAGIALPIIQTAYILCMEVCEPKHRTIVGIGLALPWCFGTMWWGVLGYLIRNWKWLQIAAIAPGFILLTFIWFIDESPRWLIVTGNHDRALQILKKAARWNKATLPSDEELLNDMLEIERSSMTVLEAGLKRTHRSYWQRTKKAIKNIFMLFMTPELRRRTLLMYAVFIVAANVFYGISFNAVNFQLDPYMYMVVSGLMEMPACTIVIPLIAKLGRVPPTAAFYFICGGTIMSLAFIPSDIKWLTITLAMIGKFSITASYNIIFLMATEVFPTEVRLQGLGTSSFISSIGAVTAPYITDFVGPIYPWVPSIVFGSLSILAGVAAIFIPETLNKSLPETIVQLENETKQKKLKTRYQNEDGEDQNKFINSDY